MITHHDHSQHKPCWAYQCCGTVGWRMIEDLLEELDNVHTGNVSLSINFRAVERWQRQEVNHLVGIVLHGREVPPHANRTAVAWYVVKICNVGRAHLS